MFNLEFFTEWLQNPAKYLFVAEEARELLGYLYSEVKDLPENFIRYPQRFIEVEELGVTEASRIRGVGEQLYKQIEKLAHELSIDRIALSVWAFNRRAQAFYERLGFSDVQSRMWKSVSQE